MSSRRKVLFGLATLTCRPGLLWASSANYSLDQSRTHIGFWFRLNGIWQQGNMPVATARISLDTQRLHKTEIAITLDARAARTGLIFATQAMKSPEVLDVTRFPTISFRSRQILLGPEKRLSGGASIVGDLSLRGVTRPITLKTTLYRPAGSAPTDLRQLNFNLSGNLNRSAFGAKGYPKLVQDQIQLEIRAGIQRIG